MGIYLDGHSTTILAPEARSAMESAWEEGGNAQSPHFTGMRASEAVERARMSVSQLIGAEITEVIFTSGATEANNLAILGVARRLTSVNRPRIIVSSIEHKAVIEPALVLRAEGFEVIEAPVLRTGVVDLKALSQLVNQRTLLVSLMLANNEIGVIQPVEQAAALAHAAGALVHSDCAQALGRMPIDVAQLNVDYLSLSAHKCHGPMGVGALYVAGGAPKPNALMHGGGQEEGIRPGTVPVALCAGFGAAVDLARRHLAEDSQHCATLVSRFAAVLAELGLNSRPTCVDSEHLPGSFSFRIPGLDADRLVDTLARDVYLSTGSACNSGQLGPSHVLQAIGLSPQDARATLRVCFGRYNSSIDAELAAAHIAAACRAQGVATGGGHQ